MALSRSEPTMAVRVEVREDIVDSRAEIRDSREEQVEGGGGEGGDIGSGDTGGRRIVYRRYGRRPWENPRMASVNTCR